MVVVGNAHHATNSPDSQAMHYQSLPSITCLHQEMIAPAVHAVPSEMTPQCTSQRTFGRLEQDKVMDGSWMAFEVANSV
jgi:hypothetical protein